MTVKGLTLVYIITNVHLFLSCILSLFVSYKLPQLDVICVIADIIHVH